MKKRKQLFNWLASPSKCVFIQDHFLPIQKHHCPKNQVKFFTDGAQFNTNHEMLIWLWSSCMAKSSWCTKFVFACIPMRYLPSKSLRAKANCAITKAIAWDCHYSSFWKYFWFTPCRFVDNHSEVPRLVLANNI